MNLENIVLEKSEGIALVTINRPEVRNALNKKTVGELRQVIADLREDAEVKVVIITGAGGKAFVAGADVNSLLQRSMVETLDAENQEVFRELERLPKPVIAAINGFALGGGCELAMACDIRIASENARLGQTEVNMGILPGAGGTQRLARLVGIAKAKELIFTGEIITAQEAEKIGLVNKVVSADQLLDTAKEMAQKIMGKGPLAVRIAKMVINEGINVDLTTGLMLERLGQTAIFATEDHIEGIKAFLEKRSAEFKGK